MNTVRLMGRWGGDNHEGGRSPAPAVNLPEPCFQVAGDVLTPVVKLILNHPDGGEVHPAFP